MLEEVISTAPTAQWLDRLCAAEVPCAPLNNLADVYRDPQVEALGLIKDASGFRISDFKYIDLPISFDGERARVRYWPARLGEHTDSVLAEVGYDSSDIEKLRRSGVIGGDGER